MSIFTSLQNILRGGWYLSLFPALGQGLQNRHILDGVVHSAIAVEGDLPCCASTSPFPTSARAIQGRRLTWTVGGQEKKSLSAGPRSDLHAIVVLFITYPTSRSLTGWLATGLAAPVDAGVLGEGRVDLSRDPSDKRQLRHLPSRLPGNCEGVGSPFGRCRTRGK